MITPFHGALRQALKFTTLVALFVMTVSVATDAHAHRLDECLQAARIAVGENRVEIELDLTPGAEVASKVLALVDLDRDGRISALEGEAYADMVRSALALQVDGKPTPLAVELDEFPSAEDIKAGVGMIRLNLTATVPAFRAGSHRLLFQNRHQPELSVYLVNALLPDSKRIEVTGQRRDVSQREFFLEFTVK